MKIAWFLPAVLLIAIAAQPAAQKPTVPNFSGDWVLDPARSTTSGTPASPATPRGGGPGAPMSAPVSTPAAPPTGGASGPVRPGGRVKEPEKTKHENPVYPADAVQAGVTGMVILDAVIGKDGHVTNVRVLKGVPGLDQAAVDAVSKWECSPTLLDGKPIDVILTVTVVFNMTRPGQAPAASPTFGGRGAVGAPSFTIKQDNKTLKMARSLRGGSVTITYRLDGKESMNRLTPGPAAGDGTFSYVSHWEDGTLVTDITSAGSQTLTTRRETIALNGDTLVIKSIHVDVATGQERYTQTNVYTRKPR